MGYNQFYASILNNILFYDCISVQRTTYITYRLSPLEYSFPVDKKRVYIQHIIVHCQRAKSPLNDI